MKQGTIEIIGIESSGPISGDGRCPRSHDQCETFLIALNH